MEAPIVKLGSRTVTLSPPPPIAALGLLGDGAADADRLESVCRTVAALAICWPRAVAWPAAERPAPWRASRGIVDYGARAYDSLVRGRCSIAEIATAANAAYTWATAHVVTEEEAQTAADFSAAQEVEGSD